MKIEKFEKELAEGELPSKTWGSRLGKINGLASEKIRHLEFGKGAGEFELGVDGKSPASDCGVVILIVSLPDRSGGRPTWRR